MSSLAVFLYDSDFALQLIDQAGIYIRDRSAQVFDLGNVLRQLLLQILYPFTPIDDPVDWVEQLTQGNQPVDVGLGGVDDVMTEFDVRHRLVLAFHEVRYPVG